MQRYFCIPLQYFCINPNPNPNRKPLCLLQGDTKVALNNSKKKKKKAHHDPQGAPYNLALNIQNFLHINTDITFQHRSLILNMTLNAQDQKSCLIPDSLVLWMFEIYFIRSNQILIYYPECSLISLTFPHLGDWHCLLIGFEKRPIAQTRNSSQ